MIQIYAFIGVLVASWFDALFFFADVDNGKEIKHKTKKNMKDLNLLKENRSI